MSLFAAFLLGGLVVFLLVGKWWWGKDDAQAVPSHSGDLPLLLDLLRRAHGAAAACLTVSDHDPTWAMATPGPSVDVLERALAAARLAMNDGRDHVLDEGQVVVAAGDGRQVGGALIFDADGIDAHVGEAVVADLRRVFVDLGVPFAGSALKDDRKHDLPEWLAGGPESVEGIAFQLCEAALDVSGRHNALVLRDTGSQVASVIAVSAGTDRRLMGAPVSPSAAIGRASMSDVPIVGANSEELFGALRADRRRETKGGVAFPLWDGRECIGALAVFGDHSNIDPSVRDQIQWLVKNEGPRLGRAAALRSAETRATTDELTGLANRRALERAMHDHSSGPCSVLCVDLDHFKALNDGFGHVAGDAALRHVAAIFNRVLRTGDLPARVGGEEFALWLPGAPASKALEVADRVRETLKESVLDHGGAEIQITCSIGVASIPESVSHVDNLLGAGDIALYRAKETGRDRVEMSLPGPE